MWELFNPWTSDLEAHTNAFFFTWASWRYVFFSIFLVLKKSVLDRCSSDQLCMSAVQCFRRGGGFWQFVEHLLRIEQKRQDGLACDEEPWCPSGSDSSDRRSELDGESEVSDFSTIDMATIDQRFFSSLWWNLLASGDSYKNDCGTVHVVFTMSNLWQDPPWGYFSHFWS